MTTTTRAVGRRIQYLRTLDIDREQFWDLLCPFLKDWPAPAETAAWYATGQLPPALITAEESMRRSAAKRATGPTLLRSEMKFEMNNDDAPPVRPPNGWYLVTIREIVSNPDDFYGGVYYMDGDELSALEGQRAKSGPDSVGFSERIGRNTQMAKFPQIANTNKPKAHADPMIVALACVEQMRQQALLMPRDVAVLSREHGRSDPKINPKVPHICKEFGVPCFNILELFQREGWRFD